MSVKDYPPIVIVRQALRYDDGHLFWLVRPRDHFANQQTWNAWNTRFSEKEAGCAREVYVRKSIYHPVWQITLNSKHFQRNAVVWALLNGEWVSGLDHKNRDSLDDRIENLRPATQTQNSGNCGARKRNKSGYKGVSWHAGGRKWQASIQFKGHSMGLGLFDDPAEAHAAYVAAARKYFGEFSCDGKP